MAKRGNAVAKTDPAAKTDPSAETKRGDLYELARHAEAAEALLKALANRSRLMVLCALHEGELSVSELNERVPLSQSALSQHLATLRRAELVGTRRDAQTIYYHLSEPLVGAVIAVLHAHYCGASPAAGAPRS